MRFIHVVFDKLIPHAVLRFVFYRSLGLLFQSLWGRVVQLDMAFVKKQTLLESSETILDVAGIIPLGRMAASLDSLMWAQDVKM